MFKWVLGLCAVMYVVLKTMGEPTAEELADRETRDLQEVTQAQTVALVTQAEPQDASPVIDAEQADAPLEIESPVLVSTAAAEPEAEIEPQTPTVSATLIPATIPDIIPATEPDVNEGPNPIWRVTARAVNLRAGPSTSDAVVGRTNFNDSAEVIELLPSGWAKVYILESGTEAFMSAQFLAAPE